MTDDLISRQAAIDAAIRESQVDGAYGYMDAKDIVDMLKDLPSAPERKKGKWIDDRGLYQCSCCKHLWSELWWVENCPMERMYKIMRFCPNCGAQMKGEEHGLD